MTGEAPPDDVARYVSRDKSHQYNPHGDLTVNHIYLGDTAAAAEATDWRGRSGYLDRVRNIAPRDGLDGRDPELWKLAAFCAGDEPYVWWQAEPWAGKTALMSTFAKEPHPGLDVVSFFITASDERQSDSVAFTEALLDQLSALLGKPLPVVPTVAGRDNLRRALLREAAARARAEGRRLVLVVDGLDEDRGRPSIASLLPKVPDDGLRIIVSSRPDLDLGRLVAPDHPLHTCPVRQLSSSEHAKRIEQKARDELEGLLRGSKLHRQVIGLITACRGGLSQRELVELTDLSEKPHKLERLLDGLFTRTIALRSDGSPVNPQRLFVFAHDTLREEAEKRLEPKLDKYRDRIHRWAERYRDWPADTPTFLLTRYPSMLRADGDVDRLVRLVTDATRHDRLLAVTGGDAAAHVEIEAAQQEILNRSEPDLHTLVRLAMRRDDLAVRNANIPTYLPAVWAALGQTARAESLAHGITDPDRRGRALTEFAREVAGGGDLERATTIAGTVTVRDRRARAFGAVAEDLARAGRHDAALTVIGHLAGSDWYPYALAGLARTVAASGDRDRATGIIDAVEPMVAGIADPFRRARTLFTLVQAVAATGDRDRAMALADESHAVVGTVADPQQRLCALVDLARVMTAVSGLEHALTYAGPLDDPEALGRVLLAVAETLTAEEDFARAMSMVNYIDDPYLQARALATLAARDHNRVRPLTEAALTAIGSIGNVQQADRARSAVAQAIAANKDRDRAVSVARRIADPSRRFHALRGIARALAAVGEYDAAETVVQTITDPAEQAAALAALGRAAVGAGEHRRAATLAEAAEALARTVPDPARQIDTLRTFAEAVAASAKVDDLAVEIADLADRLAAAVTHRDGWATRPDESATMLIGLVEAVAVAGAGDRAERLTQAIAVPAKRARVLGALALLTAAAGDSAAVVRFADAAHRIIAALPDGTGRAGLATPLMRAVAMVGDFDRALAIADSISRPGGRAKALAELAEIMAAHDHLDRAEPLAHAIRVPFWRANALAALARAAAAGQDHRTRALADATYSAAAEVTSLGYRVKLDRTLVRTAAAVGDYGHALDTVSGMTNAARQAEALAELAQGLAANQHYSGAAAAARTIPDAIARAQCLADLARTVARSGKHGQARKLIADAEGAARDVAPPYRKGEVLVTLVAAVAALGDHDRAVAIADGIAYPDQRTQALGIVAEAMTAAGRQEAAEALVAAMPAAQGRAQALTRLAELAVRRGEVADARRLLTRVLTVGAWTVPLRVLGQVEPELLRLIVKTYGDAAPA